MSLSKVTCLINAITLISFHIVLYDSFYLFLYPTFVVDSYTKHLAFTVVNAFDNKAACSFHHDVVVCERGDWEQKLFSSEILGGGTQLRHFQF